VPVLAVPGSAARGRQAVGPPQGATRGHARAPPRSLLGPPPAPPRRQPAPGRAPGAPAQRRARPGARQRAAPARPRGQAPSSDRAIRRAAPAPPAWAAPELGGPQAPAGPPRALRLGAQACAHRPAHRPAAARARRAAPPRPGAVSVLQRSERGAAARARRGAPRPPEPRARRARAGRDRAEAVRRPRPCDCFIVESNYPHSHTVPGGIRR
jgi:hypothetical protein